MALPNERHQAAAEHSVAVPILRLTYNAGATTATTEITLASCPGLSCGPRPQGGPSTFGLGLAPRVRALGLLVSAEVAEVPPASDCGVHPPV